jgi:hypothetical protein
VAPTSHGRDDGRQQDVLAIVSAPPPLMSFVSELLQVSGVIGAQVVAKRTLDVRVAIPAGIESLSSQSGEEALPRAMLAESRKRVSASISWLLSNGRAASIVAPHNGRRDSFDDVSRKCLERSKWAANLIGPELYVEVAGPMSLADVEAFIGYVPPVWEDLVFVLGTPISGNAGDNPELNIDAAGRADVRYVAAGCYDGDAWFLASCDGSPWPPGWGLTG